jgi:hypothetical protein
VLADVKRTFPGIGEEMKNSSIMLRRILAGLESHIQYVCSNPVDKL